MTKAAPDAPFYAWLDVGATGTNERLDYIIETSLIITDGTAALVEKTALNLVVNPEGTLWRARLDASPAIKAIHDRSGVLKEVESGVTLGEAQEAITQTMARIGEPQDFMVAGGDMAVSVGRRFVRMAMPKVEAWLRPGSFSVDSLDLAHRLVGSKVKTPAPKRKRKPRLYDDINNRIIHTRAILEHMEKA